MAENGDFEVWGKDVDPTDDDMSDGEDLSSGDEGDGKKRRPDDRPKTKDQIDRRRFVNIRGSECHVFMYVCLIIVFLQI